MSYAYSVSVKLSVANLASQGLRLIATDMLKLHGVTTSLQTKMSALKLAAVGYGLDKMGTGIFHGLEKTVSAATEYTHQLALMNAQGMTHAEIARSIGAAWATSNQVLTSTAAGNLKQLRELRSIFGTQHMDEAYAVLPSVMRTQAVLEALTGRQNDQIGIQMAKVAELRQTGVMTLPFLQRNMNELSRTLMAMGGTLNVNDFLMTLKYAKTAGLSLNDRFVYDFLPTFMQEVKGGGGFMGNTSTAGTSVMRLYTQIVQGLVKKAAIPVWEEMGLIQPNNVVRTGTGNLQIKPGGVNGAQLFAQDPLAWVEKFTPAIDRYAARHHLTQIQAITSMGLPQNASWALSTLMLKDAQFRRDQKLIASTPMPIESYNRLLRTSPLLARQALDSQLYNVLTGIGQNVLPVLVPLMTSFAKDLNVFSIWIQGHPKITEGLVISLGALSGGLVVLGNIMMTRAVVNFLGLGPAISKMLTAPIGALGSFAKVLGGVTAAGIAGYEVGTELYNHMIAGTKVDDKLGSGIAHILAAFGSKTAQESLRLNEAYSAGQARPPLPLAQRGVIERPIERPMSYIWRPQPPVVHVTVQNKVSRDGLTTLVMQGMSKALQAPETGPSFFDGLQAPVPAGGI
jgi:hypothetical protein